LIEMNNITRLSALVFVILCLQTVSAQEICPQGKFYNMKSQSCESCPRGAIANGTVPLSQCEACPAGSYEMNRTVCFNCPEGTYSRERSSGISDCIMCKSGFISGAGAASCKECPAGSYEVDRKSCPCCPDGTYSERGATGCNRCSAGWYAWPRGAATQCKICEAGSYEVKRTTCNYCSPGTSSSTEGASDKSTCVACQPGYIADHFGSTECKKCPEGSHEEYRMFCVRDSSKIKDLSF